MVVESHDDFPGVEISIAGGVGEMVRDLGVTVASPSYRTNIRLLQKSFSAHKRKASQINVSFAVPKTEVIDWRTTRSNEPPCSLPVQLEDQLLYSQSHLKWWGFIFTPAIDPRFHFSRRSALTNAALATIRRLCPPRWAFHPTFVSPCRVRSLLRFFYMDPLFGTLPRLSWAQCPFFGIGSVGG